MRPKTLAKQQQEQLREYKKAIECNRTIGFIAYPLRVLPLYYKKEGEFELPACPYGKAIRQKNRKTNKCRGATMCAPENTQAKQQQEQLREYKKAIECNRTIGFIAYPLRVLPLYYKKEGEFELPACPYGKRQ